MARELLTVRETCREYGFPRDQLYALIRSGAIPALGGERRFLIPRRVIEDMLDAKVAEARRRRGAMSDYDDAA